MRCKLSAQASSATDEQQWQQEVEPVATDAPAFGTKPYLDV
jgi:hypothetical protein